MKLTAKQAELWKVAEKAMIAAGGPRVRRHPNARTEGTKEWAIVAATALASPLRDGEMADEFCQRLIDIING